MKIFVPLLSLSTGVSAIFSGHHNSKRADVIADELGPYLSPGASIILPSDNATLFAALTKRHSPISHPDITAIVRVGLGEDVPLIINYAKKKGRAFLAGSGRHGWSTTLNRAHDAIMIDISTLTQIVIHEDNTMTVGGGVIVGNVMSALQDAGKEAATGICDCVGLLGATLGGGHGRLQGLHGLMADNLLSVRLVTASGNIITVSSNSHPDLFWALRGAGHNFGIVIEAIYRIYDQTNGGLQFNANIFYAPAHIEEIFTVMNEFEPPAETNALVTFVPQANASALLVLSFVSSSPAETAVSQLDAAFGHIPYISRNESIVPWDSVNGLGLLGRGRTACGGTDRRAPSGVSVTYYDIPAILKAYQEFIHFTSTYPNTTSTIMLFEGYSVKGVQAVPGVDTAYPHRQEKGVVLLTASYYDEALDDVAESWLGNVTGILHGSSGFEKPAVYMNYAQGSEGFGAMYGYEKWRQERLRRLKKRYDPECLFSWYQPIPCS